MKPDWPYSALRGVSVLLILGGVFSLLSHLAGQVREGWASSLSLTGGGCALIFGILFAVLADIGCRLVRLEVKLGTLPKNEFTQSDQPRVEREVAQDASSASVGQR